MKEIHGMFTTAYKPFTEETCGGAGIVLPRGTDTWFGNTVCPYCGGIAQVDTTGDLDMIEPTHTVRVIG